MTLELAEVMDIPEKSSLGAQHVHRVVTGIIDTRDISHVGEFTCETFGLYCKALPNRKTTFISPGLEAASSTFVVSHVSNQCNID